MLTLTLIALTVASPPKALAPACTLGGQPVQARWSGTIPLASTADAPLRAIADAPLPGSASRFDYQSLESASGRLFMSHMGAGQLVVFDVRAGRVIGNLDGFPTATGVLAVPAEHRAYASATGDHAVVVVDDSTLQIVARVRGPRFPDGIAYAPEERRVFVSDESGRRDFVIDAATNSVVARIELDGEAGNTQYDPGSHCVIVAVQTANQLVVIDPATATIVRRITLDNAVRFPHGVYIDAPHRLVFVAGQESATLGVLDLQTLELRQVLPIGSDPDVLALDPSLGHLYVAAESGVLAVFEERDGSLAQLGWYRAPRAHSVAVDPGTHRVYVPLANLSGRPVLRILAPTGSGSAPPVGQTPLIVWHFDSLPVGQPPAGFAFARTGGGRVGHWIVQTAPDAPSPPNVLVQVDSDRTDYRFPIATAPLPTFTDGSVSVKCKPVSGRVDRACGIVFRYQDDDNYFLTRANALENNVRFYYVKNGRRSQLATWSGTVTSGVWHELRVGFQGDHVEVYWDGTKRIDAHDATFTGPGRVGVWTKADSYTLFDDFSAKPQP
jgi:DNA-binding beta-propeller fold protein YncE